MTAAVWRDDMENAPRGGTDISVKFTITMRASWSDSLGRWILARHLCLDYVPDRAEWRPEDRL